MDDYDVLVLAGGAELPRDLAVPGRELDGVHFAMDFLTQQNKRNAGDAEAKRRAERHDRRPPASMSSSSAAATPAPTASAPRTARARPRSPSSRSCRSRRLRENKALTWPDWPLKLRTSSSQEEGLRARILGAHQASRRRRRRGRRPCECVRVEWRRARRPHGHAARSPAASSSSRPTSSCWPWASSARAQGRLVEQAGVELTPRGKSGQRRRLPDLEREASSPAATCAAASRWWSGRSARAGNARRRWMRFSRRRRRFGCSGRSVGFAPVVALPSAVRRCRRLRFIYICVSDRLERPKTKSRPRRLQE